MSTGTAWPHPALAPGRLAMPHDRWPTGTRAAAGTIPVRPVNTFVILVRSQGHHPANCRPAIPTRVYESGSGRSHQPAPVGHPHPARSPPDGFVLIIMGVARGYGAAPPASRVLRIAARRPTAALDPGASATPGAGDTGRPGLPTDPHHPHDDQHKPVLSRGAPQTTGRVHGTPLPRPPHNTKKNRQHGRNQARGAVKVDEPLHMRSGRRRAG
jgi:hypothetical protein